MEEKEKKEFIKILMEKEKDIGNEDLTFEELEEDLDTP